MDRENVVIYEKHEAIAVVTLNRPEARNALSPEMLCRMADAFADAQADADVRVIILTAVGDQAFCAGGDLGLTLPLFTGDRAASTKWDSRLLNDPQVRSLSSLCDTRIDKPFIAAVNGVCMAAGAELILGTDIRIATESARFAWPEVQRGLIPFAGSLSRLPAQIPYSQAMQLLLTGEPINAQDALAIGLINKVVPSSKLMSEAKKIAKRIANNGPLAIRTVKATATASLGLSQEEAFSLEKRSYDKIMASTDAREGPRAFMEKREPVFRGH